MDNKMKKWILWGSVAAAVLVIIGVAVTVCLLVGGGSSMEKTLEASLDSEVEAMQLISKWEGEPEFLTDLESRIQCDVISMEAEGDIANAVVRVSAPDLYTVLKNMEDTQPQTEEEAQQAIAQAIADADMVESEVAVVFEKVDGNWELVWTEEFFNAYYGGILQLRTEYFEQEAGGKTDEG